jgi:4-amino-4-deoxy-L-arabinose transferase-like glycosyltransferase
VGRAHRSENAARRAAETATTTTTTTTWAIGLALVLLATALRLAWVLAVPTVPVSDFAMYRESANYLSEFGSLDHGFIYMPGFVVLLAWIKDLGGDLLAQKIPGVIFGGLGAGGLFALTLNLFESRRIAVIATLLYALWPAGVAMSSVVGTDVPAAALLATALAVLVGLGPRRPWAAAIGFGVVMGVAAWVRAVALPLTALSLGYWITRRTRWSQALALTGAAVAATLLVLLPWGLRHVRESGHLYFTDDHGGITALIGANPNSEGTYTRALNQLFHELTGRSVLDEPHHETDRAAYALAREWTRFEPAYALGLAAKKAERLFEPEQRLLYWSIFRPGVLIGARAAWFRARRQVIGEAADAFGIALAGLALAGLGIAAAERRWKTLALVPFQLALAATYTLFFAEPRYRLPIELLAFPFAALTLVETGRAGVALARWAWTRTWSWPDVRQATSALGTALAFVLIWLLAWPATLEAGAGLRARHRWAATAWQVDGRARLAKWRPTDPLPPISPVEGGPAGVGLRADGARPSTAEMELGGGPLAPGTYALVLTLAAAAPARLRLRTVENATLTDVTPTPTPTPTQPMPLHHAGGILRLTAAVESGGPATIWISDARLVGTIVSDPLRPGS